MNYKLFKTSEEPRTELHDVLGLTGAEISINSLPQGAAVPFFHSHKQNEEIYYIIEGKGVAIIDGEEINISKGDFIKVDPNGLRQFKASNDSGITYICIQVKANSLEGYTINDAIIK